MISDPEAVRDVFRGDPDVLHSGEANSLFTATVGRHSVLVLDSAPHARQCRVLSPPSRESGCGSSLTRCGSKRSKQCVRGRSGAPFRSLTTMRRVTLRVILRTGLGLAPGPKMDGFEKKIERFLSNGRQRYALVLMAIIPIQRLSGSRWVPLFRQLSDLDDDLFALIAARRRGDHVPSGQNVLDDLLAARTRTARRWRIAKCETHSSRF